MRCLPQSSIIFIRLFCVHHFVQLSSCCSCSTLLLHRPVQPSPGPSEPALWPPPGESTDWEFCSAGILSPLWRVWGAGLPSPGPAGTPPRQGAPPPGPAGCGPGSEAAGALRCGGACCWWSRGLDGLRGNVSSGQKYESAESRGLKCHSIPQYYRWNE